MEEGRKLNQQSIVGYQQTLHDKFDLQMTMKAGSITWREGRCST